MPTYTRTPRLSQRYGITTDEAAALVDRKPAVVV